jgi:hypothetical protein
MPSATLVASVKASVKGGRRLGGNLPADVPDVDDRRRN